MNKPSVSPQATAEHDIVIAVDASMQMAGPSSRLIGQTLWDEVQQNVAGLVAVLAGVDPDGADIIMFGDSVEAFERVTPDDVASIFGTRRPLGPALVAEAIERAFAIGHGDRNVAVIVLLSSAPPIRAAVDAQLDAAVADQERVGSASILFVQVGDGHDADDFLTHIDGRESNPHFATDTLRSAESETMAPADLIGRAVRGRFIP